MNKLTVIVQSTITHLTSLFVPEVAEIFLELVSLSEHMRFPYVLMGLYCSLCQLVVLSLAIVCCTFLFIVVSALLRHTASDYLFGIFKLVLELRSLITSLVFSNFVF